MRSGARAGMLECSSMQWPTPIPDAFWGPETLNSTAFVELVHLIKSAIGVTAAVDVREPESIERSVGKMRRIVDLRRHGE